MEFEVKLHNEMCVLYKSGYFLCERRLIFMQLLISVKPLGGSLCTCWPQIHSALYLDLNSKCRRLVSLSRYDNDPSAEPW